MVLDRSPWFYLLVGLTSAVAVSLLQVWRGGGIDWFNVVAISVGAMVGAYVGLRLRARRLAR